MMPTIPWLALLGLFASSTSVPTPEELYQQAQKLYLQETQGHHQKQQEKTLDGIKQSFQSRENALATSSDEAIQQLLKELNRFLANYPQHRFTPYVRFDLASRYFRLGEKYPECYRLAERLLNDLPNLTNSKFAYREESLYLLAYAQLKTQQEKLAVNNFTKLVNQFPKSRYIPESSLRIAEYYFHQTKYKQAAPYYQQAVADKKSPVYFKALYKLAWVDYLTGNYARALDNFMAIVEQRDQTEFYDEAKEYVAICFHKLKSGQNALAYLKRRWHDEYLTILLRYAEICADQSEFKMAAHLYEQVANEFPKQPQAAEALYLAAQMWAQQGQQAKARSLNTTLLNRFTNPSPTRMKVLFELATYHYQQWLRQPHLATHKPQAGAHFDEIIRTYPQSREAYEAQFFLGEIYYGTGDYRQADLAYQNVLLNLNYNQHFGDALRSRVACQEKMLASARGSKERQPVAEKLLQAIDDFVVRAAENADKNTYQLAAIRLLKELKRPDQAKARLEKLMTELDQLAAPTPNQSKIAKQAAQELMVLLAEAKQWQDLITWSESLAEFKLYRNDTSSREIFAAANYDAYTALAAELEGKKEYLLAANQYQRLLERHPKRLDLDDVYQHTLHLYLKAGKPEAALALLTPLAAHYSATAKQKALLLELARLQRDFLMFKAVGPTLAPLIKEKSPAAGLLAADVLVMQGDPKAAAALYGEIAYWSRDPKIRATALQASATQFELSGQLKSAISAYEKLIPLMSHADARLGVLRCALIDTDLNKARAIARELAKNPKTVTTDQRPLYAMLQGDLAQSAFRQQPLYQSNQLNPNKLADLEQAESHYLKALKLGSSFLAHEALYKIADMYTTIATDLTERSEPADLALAEKLKAKAQQIHQKNMALAAKQNSTSKWLVSSRQYVADHGGPLVPLNDYRFIQNDTLVFPPYNTELLPSTPYNMAHNYLQQHDYRAAQAQLKPPVMPRTSPEARLLLAWIAAKSGNYLEARQIYKTYLSEFPETPAVQQSLVWVEMAMAKYDEALAQVTSLMQKLGRQPELIGLAALALAGKKQFAAAEYLLRGGLKQSPENFSLKTSLMSILLQLERYDELATLYGPKLGQNPIVLNNSAMLYYLAGNYGKAEEVLIQALKLHTNLDSLYNLALTQWASGKSELAKSSYARFNRLGGSGGKLAQLISL